MKNVLTTAAIALLIGMNACKQVDEKLVGELQQGNTTLEKAKPASDTASMNLEQLRMKMASIEGEKSMGAKYVANKMLEKYDKTMVEYNKTKEDLKGLIENYEAGLIKKEEVETKYKVLQNKIENFEKSFHKLSQLTQRNPDELIELGTQMAKSEGVDLSKPVSSDMLGQDRAPAANQGAPADGGATLQGNGQSKKKDGGK